MITYTLWVVLCSPGAWSPCSNGLKEYRLESIATKEACNEELERRKKLNSFRDGACLPVKK